MAISSTGIGSGLDVNSIVTQLVAIEKQPLKTLATKATNVNAQVSALGDIKSQFASLTDVATRLSSADAWVARNASSSNTSAATIAVTSAAAANSFTLDVDALAQKQATSSEAITAGSYVGAGTMTIRVGTWSGNISSNAGADNAAQAAADASSPALAVAQAALATAQTDLTDATTALGDRNTDLTNANTALDAAQGVLDAANTALTAANDALAPYAATLASANLALTSADSALLAATNAKTAAETASAAADLASTDADAALVVADADVVTKNAATTNANLDLSNAFSEDSGAASALAAFAVGTPIAKSYSDSYTAWVSAVAANDHVTPSLQAAEDAALSARNIAYTTFGLLADTASAAAIVSRDSALDADADAAAALATYSSNNPSDAILQAYSDAYTAWTTAVDTQTGEAAALVAKNAAYTALAKVVVDAQTDATKANVDRDNALAADSSAAQSLATLAASNPLLQSYSNAYADWVSAVAANDHVTLSLQTEEDNALTAKNAAFTALGQVGAAELTAANSLRDSALDANTAAAIALDSFANPGGSLELQAYSTAYTAWTTAVETQTNVVGTEAAKNLAYALMTAPEQTDADVQTASADPASTTALIVAAQTAATTRAAAVITGSAAQAAANTVTYAADSTDASALKAVALTKASEVSTAQSTLADANALTATADATDASALIAAAITAAGVVTAADALTVTAAGTDASALKTAAVAAAAAETAAIATAAAATSAAAIALTNKNNAAATVVTATDALGAPTAAQAIAAANVLTATNDAAAATAAVQTAADAVTTATGVRDTAQGDVTSATTARNAAQSLVTTATAAVAAATANVTSATALRPTFTAATGSSDFTITTTATDTVATLAAKINAAGAGVVAMAFFDGSKDRLLLMSKDSGKDAGFRVQVSDTGDTVDNDNNGLSRMAYDPGSSAYGMASAGNPATYGSDARVRINGMVVTSKTNTLTGNLAGVTIDLKAVTTSSATMSITEDATLAIKNVNDFVTAYNTLDKTLADLTKYNASTKAASLFQADSSILGLQNVLRNMLRSVSTGSVYQRLNDIGLERQLDGSLKVNSTKLSTAANNGTELQKLFIADNGDTLTNGFARKFATLGTGLLGLDGAVTNKTAALQSALARNAKDQARVTERAAMVEARLRKTYSALDAKMASLTALNSYVAQQVTTWNKSSG